MDAGLEPSPVVEPPAAKIQQVWPWYAVRVKPKFERVVAQSLASKDIPSFLPLYKERRRWSDRVKLVELPLFPGYVFCSLDIRRRLPALQTPGVLHFVSFDGEPAPVDPSELETLQQAVASGTALAPWPYLKEGQRVVVARGPMKGRSGILLKIRDEYRLIISITLLQRSVAVEIDREAVQPA
ncbi:MAG: UpxY family transcription antiterminator [Bryobacteraceae bacterium]